MRTSHTFQHLYQLLSHGSDAIGHLSTIRIIFACQDFIAQYNLDNIRTMDRWTRIHGSNNQFQLTQHRLLLQWRIAYHAQCSGPFAVQTKILRKGLGQYDAAMSSLYKVSQSVGIGFGIPGGESLIGRIEEYMMRFGLDEVGDGMPLFVRGIASGGIVSTGM